MTVSSFFRSNVKRYCLKWKDPITGKMKTKLLPPAVKTKVEADKHAGRHATHMEAEEGVFGEDIADDLRKKRESLYCHRRKLSQVISQVRAARSELALLQRSVVELQRCDGYPPVPPPFSDSKLTPFTSGIYFVWDEGVIVYVGKSVCIAGRAVHGKHEKIYHGDQLSWIEWPTETLSFAESYYIGICRSVRNFTSDLNLEKSR